MVDYDIQTSCCRDKVMMACKERDSTELKVLAWAPRGDVFGLTDVAMCGSSGSVTSNITITKIKVMDSLTLVVGGGEQRVMTAIKDNASVVTVEKALILAIKAKTIANQIAEPVYVTIKETARVMFRMELDGTRLMETKQPGVLQLKTATLIFTGLMLPAMSLMIND